MKRARRLLANKLQMYLYYYSGLLYRTSEIPTEAVFRQCINLHYTYEAPFSDHWHSELPLICFWQFHMTQHLHHHDHMYTFCIFIWWFIPIFHILSHIVPCNDIFQVEYNADGFIEKNKGKVPESLLDCVRKSPNTILSLNIDKARTVRR